MKKYLLPVTLIFLFVGIAVFIASKIFPFASKSDTGTSPSVQLTCDNGYVMTIEYSEPDKNESMTRMSLNVFKDGTTRMYDMRVSQSGSGAKFQTQDQKYSLWEHQGEFTFAIDEKEEALCEEIPGL